MPRICSSRATPRILPPSAAKLLYTARLHDFWQGMGDAGYYNYGMAIIGFSLPHQDEYARQILYEWVTTIGIFLGRRNVRPKKDAARHHRFLPIGAPKTNFIERYRFVDWSRAHLSGDCFDLASLIGYSLER